MYDDNGKQITVFLFVQQHRYELYLYMHMHCMLSLCSLICAFVHGCALHSSLRNGLIILDPSSRSRNIDRTSLMLPNSGATRCEMPCVLPHVCHVFSISEFTSPFYFSAQVH